MDVPDREAGISITYRSPTLHRLFMAFKTTFTTIMLMVLVAVLFWAGLLRGALAGQAPPWIHFVGLALLVPVPVLVIWLVYRKEPMVLTLHEDHLRLGGRLFGSDILFDDVRLVKHERPQHTVGKSQHLVIQWQGGVGMSIWLSPADAAECFDALRQLCEHIPALGPGDKVYEPVKPKSMYHARWVLAREFRRKARRALLSAVVCTIIGSAVAAGLITGGAAARNRPRAWMALVILPAGAIGSAVAFSQYRRKVKDLDRQNDEWEAAAKANAKRA